MLIEVWIQILISKHVCPGSLCRASNSTLLNYLKFIYAEDFSYSPFQYLCTVLLIHTILLPLVELLGCLCKLKPSLKMLLNITVSKIFAGIIWAAIQKRCNPVFISRQNLGSPLNFLFKFSVMEESSWFNTISLFIQN